MRLVDSIEKHIDKAEYTYLIMVFVLQLLYFVVFFGIITIDQNYIRFLNIFMQSFIILFLLYRFHPYRETFIIKRVDLTIVFGSALLLGTNLISVELKNLHFTPENNVKNILYNIK